MIYAMPNQRSMKRKKYEEMLLIAEEKVNVFPMSAT